MSLAKIVVTGTVTKNPEKRFTQNNLPITSLIIDINPQDETIVRVISVGALAERTADSVSVGDMVIVDGRLQTETVKTTSGKERKIAEISAGSIEKIGGISTDVSNQGIQTQAVNSSKPQEIVQFATEEISENLIDEDEIPF